MSADNTKLELIMSTLREKLGSEIEKLGLWDKIKAYEEKTGPDIIAIGNHGITDVFGTEQQTTINVENDAENTYLYLVNNSNEAVPVNIKNIKSMAPHSIIFWCVFNGTSVSPVNAVNMDNITLSNGIFMQLNTQEAVVFMIIGLDNDYNTLSKPIGGYPMKAKFKATIGYPKRYPKPDMPPYKPNYTLIYFLIALVIAIVVYSMNRK